MTAAKLIETATLKYLAKNLGCKILENSRTTFNAWDLFSKAAGPLPKTVLEKFTFSVHFLKIFRTNVVKDTNVQMLLQVQKCYEFWYRFPNNPGL